MGWGTVPLIEFSQDFVWKWYYFCLEYSVEFTSEAIWGPWEGLLALWMGVAATRAWERGRPWGWRALGPQRVGLCCVWRSTGLVSVPWGSSGRIAVCRASVLGQARSPAGRYPLVLAGD